MTAGLRYGRLSRYSVFFSAEVRTACRLLIRMVCPGFCCSWARWLQSRLHSILPSKAGSTLVEHQNQSVWCNIITVAEYHLTFALLDVLQDENFFRLSAPHMRTQCACLLVAGFQLLRLVSPGYRMPYKSSWSLTISVVVVKRFGRVHLGECCVRILLVFRTFAIFSSSANIPCHEQCIDTTV